MTATCQRTAVWAPSAGCHTAGMAFSVEQQAPVAAQLVCRVFASGCKRATVAAPRAGPNLVRMPTQRSSAGRGHSGETSQIERDTTQNVTRAWCCSFPVRTEVKRAEPCARATSSTPPRYGTERLLSPTVSTHLPTWPGGMSVSGAARAVVSPSTPKLRRTWPPRPRGAPARPGGAGSARELQA